MALNIMLIGIMTLIITTLSIRAIRRMILSMTILMIMILSKMGLFVTASISFFNVMLSVILPYSAIL